MPENDPNAPHPYSVLAREILKGRQARAVFLLITDGVMGTNWVVEGPRNVVPLLPELLVDAAEDIRAGQIAGDQDSVIFKPFGPEGPYADAAEAACRLTEATIAFVFVLEGNRGTNFAVFAPPDRIELLPELIRGVAWDLAQVDPKLRKELGLEDPAVQH